MKMSTKLSISIFGSMSTLLFMLPTIEKAAQSGSTEAPAGFDNRTNGHLSQVDFDAFREIFEEAEEEEEGLGPTFNDLSCVACHSAGAVGGSSTVVETRAGSINRRGEFEEHPGGSLVQDMAISPEILEQVLPGEFIAHRISLNTLGDGFVEAIADDTLIRIANSQPASVRGTVIGVPVLEENGSRTRVGRFGWKNQHASLESFAADAYLNEMGITSPLQRHENTSDGRSVAKFDEVQDPEDDGADVRAFADFMRATKVPPRDASADSPNATQGAEIFHSIGCDTCHVPQIVTAPVGTSINLGTLTVPPALGNKIIHPYGDFLLHDIGTGDGIVQNGGASTANQMRTAPLWGVRTRIGALMHDGASSSLTDAINRHGGQAAQARSSFQALSGGGKNRLLAFLNSL
jgi:CxxC motif-containing protein (DUF1111 family)